MSFHLDFAKYYYKVYSSAIPKIFYLSTLGVALSPRRSLRMLQGVLDHEDRSEPDRVLGSMDIVTLLGKDRTSDLPDILLTGAYYAQRSSDTRLLSELSSIAYLVKAIEARRIFEIGTFVGRMTRLLTMNAENSETFTLDLPAQVVQHRIGEFYVGTPESSRIHQLYGDSRAFDFRPWRDSVDFCWVDACHDYDYVVSDTKAAFDLIKTGGWIGWHDYRHTAWWSGVTRAVRELNAQLGGGVVHVMGTTIALMQVNADAKRIVAEIKLQHSHGFDR